MEERLEGMKAALRSLSTFEWMSELEMINYLWFIIINKYIKIMEESKGEEDIRIINIESNYWEESQQFYEEFGFL